MTTEIIRDVQLDQSIHINSLITDLSIDSPSIYHTGYSNSQIWGMHDGSTMWGPYLQFYGRDNPGSQGNLVFIGDSRNSVAAAGEILFYQVPVSSLVLRAKFTKSGSLVISSGVVIGSTSIEPTAGNLQVVGNVFTVDWTPYQDTSTIVGWSSFTTKLISYKKLGKLVFFKFFLAGTSNSTAVSFTLPYTSPNDGLYGEGIVSRAQDNAVNITTACAWELAPNSSTVNCYKDHALGAWTSSGAKRVIGQGWYESA